MIRLVRVLAGTALLAAGAVAAVASPAVLTEDTAVREGPGEQYEHIWDLVAGTHVDVRECKATQWCFVVRRDKEGWVHIDGLDLYPGVEDETGSEGDAESSSGDTPSSSGRTSKRTRSPSSGSDDGDDPGANISFIVKRPDGGTASGSSGGSSTSSGAGETPATKAALGGSSGTSSSSGATGSMTLVNPCQRCN
jgi:uncharacterized protein YraI